MTTNKITKLFFIDWFITLSMYISGYVISRLRTAESLDIVSYLSKSSGDQIRPITFLDTFIYLFISVSFVVLMSFLINKGYIKASKKEFVLSQFVYFVSVTIVIFLLPFLI